MERPYPPLSRTLRKRVLATGCMLGLSLIYALTWQLQPPAEPTAASQVCKIEQKRPLFVGFAPGGGLDSFESAAVASRGIFRAVKLWLCNAAEPPAARNGHTLSLRVALHDQRPMRAERIMFDDAPLSRAHVVLAELALGQPREQGWHVHVARSPEGWSVSHASDHALDNKAPQRAQ